MTAIFDIISDHREWVFALVFLLALAETLLIVSFFVPSTAVLIGLGGLIAAGTIDLWPVFLGAALGAIAGSFFSWLLGRIYGPGLLRYGPLRRRVQQIRPVRKAFRRYGAPVIVAGHLGGPFRGFAFVFAGLSAIPAWQFLPMTILGAVLWAYLTPTLGEIGLTAIWRIFGTS